MHMLERHTGPGCNVFIPRFPDRSCGAAILAGWLSQGISFSMIAHALRIVFEDQQKSMN